MTGQALHSQPVRVTLRKRKAYVPVIVFAEASHSYVGPAETAHALKRDFFSAAYGGYFKPRVRVYKYAVEGSRWASDGRKLVHVG